MFQIKGLYTALVTPFDENGEVDEKGLRENIQYQILNNVDGVVLLGTTGEAPTLVEKERMRVVRTAREETAGRIPLVVGTGSYSTAQSVENTRQAEALGADAVLVIAPYYNRPTQEGLYLHFSKIAQATSLPIVLYNHPGRCGNAISIETLMRLAEIPNIVGVKEITSQIEHLNQVMHAVRNVSGCFDLFCGDDLAAYTFLAQGARGLISVASNLIPHAMKKLVDLAMTHQFSEALELHDQLFTLFQALNSETNPIPIKAAMNHQRFPAGPCRLPLCEMEAGRRKKLEQILHTNLRS